MILFLLLFILKKQINIAINIPSYLPRVHGRVTDQSIPVRDIHTPEEFHGPFLQPPVLLHVPTQRRWGTHTNYIVL